MATAENESAWSTTAASNNSADSSVNWTEGQDPGTVNNSARSMMAARAKARLDQGGSLVAGGTSTALTVTTNQVLSSGHITNGLRLAVRTASAATGAATIAIDGLTAVTLKKNDGTAIVSGDWASGAILDLVYSSAATAFLVTNIGAALTISGLTEDTSPDLAADFIAAYDTSGAANSKIKPKNLFPSKQSSFRAYKSASQTVSSTAETTVTFDTEAFDQGSNFTGNAWTPPAGTCVLNLRVDISNLQNAAPIIVRIKKDATEIARGVAAPRNQDEEFTVTVDLVDQCNGTNAYTATVDSDADASYTVTGAQPYYTSFQGHMI